MDKVVNGILYKKAKFLRTTCKKCGKILDNSIIKNGGKFCNRKCRLKFIISKKRRFKINRS